MNVLTFTEVRSEKVVTGIKIHVMKKKEKIAKFETFFGRKKRREKTSDVKKEKKNVLKSR